LPAYAARLRYRAACAATDSTAGSRARRRVTFLCAAKEKSPKERPPDRVGLKHRDCPALLAGAGCVLLPALVLFGAGPLPCGPTSSYSGPGCVARPLRRD